MENPYDIVLRLTSTEPSDQVTTVLLNDFAYSLGWRPSDRLDMPNISSIATTHLVVEHGLENAAVISFLKGPWRDLNSVEKRQLLGISYNNLVDWHIQVQPDEVSFIYNRNATFGDVATRRISPDEFDSLRKVTFEQIVGKRPNPNVPALDEALIRTISRWKRILSAEMNYNVQNDELSALFNAIILVRALEDHYKRFSRENTPLNVRTLRDIWRDSDGRATTFVKSLQFSILYTDDRYVPEDLVETEKLRVFDSIDRETISALVSEFYRSGNIPYEYDFSIMSKHALSRIYEHYVSILRPEDSPPLTLSFLPRLPEETWEKAYGSVYTPQFIARFFARYLKEQMTPSAFRSIRSIDPACGSGIFLRTLLELQCDPTQEALRTEIIETAFSNVTGIDVDENACYAARLSLSLLHLTLTDSFPGNLAVFASDAIDYFQQHLMMRDSFDAVLANPPFVPWDAQSQVMRQQITNFMSQYTRGKMDTYLAFLLLGLEMLKPGGYGLFVLPQSFLIATNAKQVRKLLSKDAWVRCLADLSAIRVFEDTGSYVILLILQKKPDTEQEAPQATIVKCQAMVGQALQDVVDHNHVETNAYSIYNVPQATFQSDQWVLLPSIHEAIARRLSALPTIDKFLQVRTGLITGADDVFIVPQERLQTLDEQLFVPLLRDREMLPYALPKATSHFVFYPYLHGTKLSQRQLETEFPNTWRYLSNHKEELSARKSRQINDKDWWVPTRSRPPENLMRPKIVSPHLSIVPRFSLDPSGDYAVTRSPLLYPKLDLPTAEENNLLRYFLAILNSTPTFWHVATHSHVYGGGYARLEPTTLKKTPVPNPAKVPIETMLTIGNLIDKRLTSTGSSAIQIEQQLDEIVAELYGLSNEERRAIGMGL